MTCLYSSAQSSSESSTNSVSLSTPHTIIVSIVDSRGGMDVFNIKMQSITTEQFMVLLRLLYALRENLKNTTQDYTGLLNNTMTIINIMMAEKEDNTVYAVPSANFLQAEDTMDMDDMIASCDKHTLDINLCYWLPNTTQDCPTVRPFLQTINRARLFSVDLHSQRLPNWNNMLTELNILTEDY